MRLLFLALVAAISYAQTGFDSLATEDQIMYLSNDGRYCFSDGNFGQHCSGTEVLIYMCHWPRHTGNGYNMNSRCAEDKGVTTAEECYNLVTQYEYCSERFSWGTDIGYGTYCQCIGKEKTDYKRYELDPAAHVGTSYYVQEPLKYEGDCVNNWYSKDCNQIKKDGFCPFYADDCRDTCFSDCSKNGPISKEDYYDARLSMGVDDNQMRECDAGTTWTDSRGFSCDVYEGAGWCNSDGGYGDLWCPRYPRELYLDRDNAGGRCSSFTKESTCDTSRCDWKNGVCRFSPSWCKVMPGRTRMGSFEFYAADGLTADTCCCDGTLYEDYPYEKTFAEEGTVCEDYKQKDGTPWHDKNGWTCRVYHYANLCEDNGDKTANWRQPEWGPIPSQEQQFDEYGSRPINPREACCACGGGWLEAHWDPIPPNNLRKIDKFLNKEFEVKFVNKAKKHFRTIHDLEGYFDPTHKAKADECYNMFDDDKINSEDLYNNVNGCFCELRALIDPNGDAPGYDFWKNSCD